MEMKEIKGMEYVSDTLPIGESVEEFVRNARRNDSSCTTNTFIAQVRRTEKMKDEREKCGTVAW